MKIENYKFDETEKNILKYWKDNDIYKKIKKRNSKGKKFYFLQGPPYTSGKLHMGHAWNNSLKDIALRFRRMKGLNVWDRAGYDMHGLPTEHQIQKKFKLETKQDIVNFGLEKFSENCMKFALETAKDMDKDLEKIGIWMDFENAYYPVRNEYIEGEWWLVKQAHEKGRLYEGFRTLSWCPSCATAIAKHEQEYKELSEDSIFVKFPVKGKEKEFLIIWTTTPWTIAFNLAVMAHPELDYVRAKVGDEVWVIAKGLAAPVVQAVADKKLEILEEFKGKKLEGIEYVHPWESEIPFAELKKEYPKIHTVVLTEEYVDLSAGSGLVHCAPGCGPEDYEVGHKNNIPPFNNICERGIFPKTMGKFSGLVAKKEDKKFIESLEEKDSIIGVTKVDHDYAHCERCHSPVVFRATKQWFFKVEDLKEKMIKANEKILWVPKSGQNSFRSWLENLRDNSITKQRFWGTPVPIWRCEKCDKYEVIGSVKELKEKAINEVPSNLHKPWIDKVELKCSCEAEMKRVPDILDVWIDAGTASWNCLYYPEQDNFFKEYYPAEFILEAREQIRGWFNLLMVASTLAFDNPISFKACYMHGMLTDVEGVKMSKSLGNVISPYEIIDKYGADTLRYYVCETTAGEDMNFSWEEIKLRHKNLMVLWNIHKYLIELAKINQVNPLDLDDKIEQMQFSEEERYIISKMNSTIKKITKMQEEYEIDKTIAPIQELFLNLSREYIQLVRDKAAVGSKQEKEVVVYTIYSVLFNTIKLFAPICPMITEAMYQNLRDVFKLEDESIHMLSWPDFDDKLIDKNLEKNFETIWNIIQSTLSAREKAKLNVRWPIKELVVVSKEPKISDAVSALGDLIKTQTNVKEIRVQVSMPEVKVSIKANAGKLGQSFGKDSPKIIAKIMAESPDSILSHIDEKNKFEIRIDGVNYDILKEHLIITREVPEHLEGESFRGGFVYLNKERTDDLETEGFARELMRRVQQLRKKSGLEKSEEISLFIKTSEELEEMLAEWKDKIKEKVGARIIKISSQDPAKEHEASSKEKIKDSEFEIFFEVLE